jgi:hypothetical protein
MQLIPLDEIASGASIRYTVINNVRYLSTRDFIMHMCATKVDYAGQIWRNLSADKKMHIMPILMHKFPGRGQIDQPVITFANAIKLVMLLPGKRVRQCRVQITDIISRYLDGDMTMCDEIKHNSSMGQKRSYSAFAEDVTGRVDSDGSKDMPDSQYIYATKSAAFPKLLKIGRTVNMKSRLAQLNTGCAPAPHTLVAIVPTLNMFRDECLAHEFFASKRRAGEFFEVDESEVKAYFTNVILDRYQKELFESMC